MKTKHLQVITCLLILLFCTNVRAQNDVLPRKNIDSLTATELAAYLHAIQILKDRSDIDLYNLESFSWQAWVHNASNVNLPTGEQLPRNPNEPDSVYYKRAASHKYPGSTEYGHPGQCVHHTDVFLGWHRAEFYYFEQILQNTDPDGTITDSKGNLGPATSDMRVPFWDFSLDPSGDRYPEAFEDVSSVLYDPTRHSEKANAPWPIEKLSYYIHQDWPIFGGYPKGANTTTGSAGYGTFELEVHDMMHSDFISGELRTPPFAAYDPIFFSFHAYIDLIYDVWITKHNAQAGGDMTSLDYYLRGQQPAAYNLPGWNTGSTGVPETMGQILLYTDHAKLGYEYPASALNHFFTEEEMTAFLSDKKGAPVVFGNAKKSVGTLLIQNAELAPVHEDNQTVVSRDLSASADDITNYYLDFTSPLTSSYRVDVYIHPKSVEPKIKKKKFRNKYFAVSASYWGVPDNVEDEDHTSEQGSTMNIYLGDALKDINANHNPAEWVITTVLTKH
ncbi:MAG: tyrosinase [Crocinitomicaceae bacterium]|jgi:tyrosinase